MHQQNTVSFQTVIQSAQKRPALIPLLAIKFVFQTLPGPVAGTFGSRIEIRRLVKYRVIVVAHYTVYVAIDNQIETFLRLGTIADNIAQAVDLLDAAFVDFAHHRL